MSDKCFKMLNDLGDYLKTLKISVLESFSLFDTDGSGQIGA